MLHLYLRSLNSGNCSSNFGVCYMAQKTQPDNLHKLYIYIFIFYFFASLLCYWNSFAVYIVFSNKSCEVSTCFIFAVFLAIFAYINSISHLCRSENLVLFLLLHKNKVLKLSHYNTFMYT